MKPTTRIFICVANETWTSMPEKLKTARWLFTDFQNKFDLEFNYKTFNFPEIKFVREGYGIDPDFLKNEVLTKVPFDKPYDVVCFLVPKAYWKNPGIFGVRGFSDLGTSYITVGGMEENDTAQYGQVPGKLTENSFTHFLMHELCHYFYYLHYGKDATISNYTTKLCSETEDCQDLTHYFIGQGDIAGLMKDLPLIEPRTASEEQSYWLFWVLNFLKRIFLKEKLDFPMETQIAEGLFLPPTPKKSRLEELALIMERVETGENTTSLAYRLNNPGAVKFALWQKQYQGRPGPANFSIFPTYELGKKAQLHLLRAACEGRMTAYQPSMTLEKFIRTYASSSPEIEKQNYVRRVTAFMNVSPYITIKSLLS